MGLAARVAAFLKDRPGASFAVGPSGAGTDPITYPSIPLIIKAELLLGGEWVDITSGPNGIYYETRIKIKRGRDNEASRAQPSSCKLKLKNPFRMWSPRNASGPYYGLLNRNVKLRITVNPGDGEHVRFTGYVSKWPQQWTLGDHRWVTIEANGILRRLGQGKGALKAPIYRAVMSNAPRGYWTLTESTGATQAASSVTVGVPMVPSNGALLGATTDTPDGTPALVVNGGLATGQVTPIAFENTDGWMFSFAMKFIHSPIAVATWEPLISFTTDSNDVAKWEIVAPDFSFPTQLYIYDYTGGMLLAGATADSLPTPEEYDDKWKYYQIVVLRNGLNSTVNIYYEGELASSTVVPLTSPTVGNVHDVVINPALKDWSDLNLSFQHISNRAIVAGDPQSRVEEADAYVGYVGEAPTTRFRRLCTEEGVPYTVVETDPDTETMGPQGIKSFMDLIRECEATNEGVLDETVNGELRLISRSAFWNQPPMMTIDYTSGAIKPGFLPTDDDLLIKNEWTITRSGGVSRTYTQTTGPLNVNDPEDDPNGVSKYDDSATLSLETDDQAYHHATLRTQRGTVDEMRIAIMPLHFHSNPELLAAWLQMDMANTSRFQIINPPTDMGAITSDQNMTGYEESIDRLEWTVDMRGAPSSVEQYGVLDYYGWTDCGASELAVDVSTIDTSWDIAISDECFWYHDEGDYRLTIRTEEVIVTNVSVAVGSGTSWTQTLTVTRSANGVVLAHPAGTPFVVTEPFIPVL